MEENNMNEIYHHGVPGQKWGIRRYQNKDGSLTPAGKKRADKLKAKYTELTCKRMRRNPTKTKESKSKEEPKKEVKSYKDMTNDELVKLTNRMNIEKNYLDSVKNLERSTPKQISRGKRFMNSVSNDVAKPAFKEAGRRLLTDWLIKVGKDKLDLNPKETKDALSALKKEVEEAELKARKITANEKINGKNDDPNKNLRNEAETKRLEMQKLLNEKLIKQYESELNEMSSPKSEPETKTETKPKSSTKPKPEIEGQMYIDDLFKRNKKK